MKNNVVKRYKIVCGEEKVYADFETAFKRVRILETLGYEVCLYEIIYTAFTTHQTLIYNTKLNKLYGGV